MKRRLLYLVTFVTIMIAVSSCFYDNEEALYPSVNSACDTINSVTFSGTIWPIMQSSCMGCHSGSTPSGSVTITGYSNVSALAASGALMNALRGYGVTRMPPGTAFTTCRMRQFEIWINDGKPNN